MGTHADRHLRSCTSIRSSSPIWPTSRPRSTGCSRPSRRPNGLGPRRLRVGPSPTRSGTSRRASGRPRWRWRDGATRSSEARQGNRPCARPIRRPCSTRGVRARDATLAAFAPLGDRDRVMWGAGPMSARSFADARLMETWAHGLDCHAALDVAPVDTVRLRRIAGLGLRALPYAFSLHGEQPPGDIRNIALDLRAPDGTQWRYGPSGTADVISGAAGEWCRVVTRRCRAKDTSLQGAYAAGSRGPSRSRVPTSPTERSSGVTVSVRPHPRIRPVRAIKFPGSAARATSARSAGSRTSRGSDGSPGSRSGHRGGRSSPSRTRGTRALRPRRSA